MIRSPAGSRRSSGSSRHSFLELPLQLTPSPGQGQFKVSTSTRSRSRSRLSSASALPDSDFDDEELTIEQMKFKLQEGDEERMKTLPELDSLYNSFNIDRTFYP